MNTQLMLKGLISSCFDWFREKT